MDDPTLPNLVFTWGGANFNTSGGPFAEVDFNDLGALSTFSGTTLDSFSAKAVKNNGLGGEAGTTAYNVGSVSVPFGTPIPEPATWAFMILGFLASGAVLRATRRWGVRSL